MTFKRLFTHATACLMLGFAACGTAAAGNQLAHPILQADSDSGAFGGNPGLNRGQTENDADASSLNEGLPIVYATGNLVVPEADFASQGEMGLFLTRTYNNYWGGVGVFGAKWLSDFDYKLSFNTSKASGTCYPKPGATCATPPTGTTGLTLWAHLPDGRRIQYLYNPAAGAWQENKPSPIASIVRNADGSYTLTTDHQTIEHYNATGYILSITNLQAVGWTFTYDANNYLQKVTHTSGRFVQLHWTGNQLTSVNDPQGNVYSYTYLANQLGTGLNVLSTTTLPGTTPVTISYSYTDTRFPGGLTGKAYAGIAYSSYAFDAAGDATNLQVGSTGYTFAYTRGTGGLMTVVESLPLPGRTITYKFSNSLITSTAATGGANCVNGTKTHTYDTNGYDKRINDFNGNGTVYTYAANGQLQNVAEAYGSTVERDTYFLWDSYNRPTRVNLYGDHIVNYAYDPVTQRVASVSQVNTSANGVASQAHTTTYTYVTYPSGLIQTMTADGPIPGTSDAIVSNFSSSGDLTSVQNSLGQATTYSTYNGLGEVGHVAGPNGDATDYTYDARGRVSQVQTYPNGVTSDTTYTYDASGLMTGLATADGVIETYAYNGARQLTSKTRATNGTVAGGAQQEEEAYTYDVFGDLTETDDIALLTQETKGPCTQWQVEEGISVCVAWGPDVPKTYPTTTRSSLVNFDGAGRLLNIGGNNMQDYRRTGYDANGNPTTVYDSYNHETVYTYDALNRRATVTDANKGNTTYTYDAANRVIAVADPRNLVTSYVYDGFGQLWAQSSPDTGTVSFAYDAAGRRTSFTRADGTVTTYGFDALNRIASITAGSPAQTQSFVYDTCTNGKGRLCTVTDGAGQTNILKTNYSPEGWVTAQTSNLGGTVYSTAFMYDNMGRVLRVAYPDGVIAHYTYNTGKLASVTVTIGGVTSNVATGLTYEPYAGPAAWTYGNGLLRGIDYDMDGRLQGLSTSTASNGVLQSLTYGYDENNSITSITNGVTASLTQSFQYDPLVRLTNVSSSSTSTLANATWGYDLDSNRSSQITATGSTTYTLASNSNEINNLTGVGPRTFGFDANGNRISDSGVSGAITYHYDPFNRMDSATKGGSTTTYHVDPLGRRVSKWNSATSSTTFVYAFDSTLMSENAVTSIGTAITDYLWMGGEPVAMVRNNALYMIHTDHLGRPEIVTNPSQSIVWRASNFAFDRAVALDGIGGLNLGFPGQYDDLEIGLWNNGYRDYDATVGRYIESDPTGLNAGINTFGYVSGNPISRSDSLGLTDGWFHYGPNMWAPNPGSLQLDMREIVGMNYIPHPFPMWSDSLSRYDPQYGSSDGSVKIGAEIASPFTLWAGGPLGLAGDIVTAFGIVIYGHYGDALHDAQTDADRENAAWNSYWYSVVARSGWAKRFGTPFAVTNLDSVTAKIDFAGDNILCDGGSAFAGFVTMDQLMAAYPAAPLNDGKSRYQ